MADLTERSARETQQLHASAQREADETRETARRKADEMLESAETRTQDLARSAEAIWRERRRLIDDMRQVGEQLVAIGEAEGKRFARLDEGVPLGTDPIPERTSTATRESLAQPRESART
jgi:cell division septum initiation protein DivIVA